MLCAKITAMSGSSVVTVPTWYNGSSYLRLAKTSQHAR
jgi:hypothetical protein